MNFKKLLKQIGATGSFAASFAIFASIIGSGFAPPEAILFLTTFLGTGGFLTKSLLNDAKIAQAIKDLEESKRLVLLISNRFGKISLAELMVQMDIPLPELKAKLDELQKEGILGMEVSNSGEVLYTVSNPISLEDRLHTHQLIQ
jgi:hypothetical protein